MYDEYLKTAPGKERKAFLREAFGGGQLVDQLFELGQRMFPQDFAGADPYPDNLTQPIMNIPEGVKYRKVKAVKRMQ